MGDKNYTKGYLDALEEIKREEAKMERRVYICFSVLCVFVCLLILAVVIFLGVDAYIDLTGKKS